MTDNRKRLCCIFIVLIFLVIGYFLWMMTQQKSPDVKTYNINWINQQNSFNEAFENCDAIIVGQVKSMDTFENQMVVFTMASVEPIKILKGEIKKKVKILFTGGTLNGTIYKSEQCVLPTKNGRYLFLLKARENEDEFIPIGGYQGVFEIDMKENGKIIPFNQQNTLEKEIINKPLKEILYKK